MYALLKSLAATIAVVGTALTVVPVPANAASKFERIDVVREGIDLKPALVTANANGYSGFRNNERRFYLRVFAKGRGKNNIFGAGIGPQLGMSMTEVNQQQWLYIHRGSDDGWGVYKTSYNFVADMRKLNWTTTPGQACRDNMARKIQQGMSKSKVLSREWKTEARVWLYFYAGAASRTAIKNGNYKGNGETRVASVSYPVPVLCEAKL